MTQQGEGVAQPPYPREPNVHSGGKQEPGSDRELPPYGDRQTSGPTQEELAKDPQKAGPGSQAGPRQVSQAEREGMSDTDTSPAGPLGVGISTSDQGNEGGLTDSEETHRADRLDTGVSREGNVDPQSPAVHSGDQGS
jgi:hypothetical protein